MPSIQKYRDGYRVFLWVKNRRDSGTFPTKRAAQLWAARRTIELEAAADGREGQLHTVQDAIAHYAKNVSPRHKGSRWEQVRLEKMARELPSIPIARFTSDRVKEWRDRRLTQVAGSSVLREMKLLGSVLEHAKIELKWLDVNPVRSVKKPPSPPHRKTIIRGWQIRRMLRALGYPRLESARHAVAHAFLLALMTGMRAGELAGLTWANVQGRVAHLPTTKNGQAREVSLSKTARKLIERMRGYDDVSVFNVTPAAIDAQFRQARARAGLSGFTFHDSRHTAATRIGMSRALSLEQLCVMFGWSNPRMALVYFNPSAADIADLL